MTTTHSILLVGLSPEDAGIARRHFESAGHAVAVLDRAPDGQQSETGPHPGVIYLQPSNPEGASRDLAEMRTAFPGVPVVVVCPRLTSEHALEAWHAGAADAIPLPLREETLDGSLGRAVDLMGDGSPQIAEGQARFRYLDESGRERWSVITGPRFTLGRSSNNDLVFTQMNISRAQAEVSVEGSEHVLLDAGSKHGTFVNGARIERTVLRHGDRIQLGGAHGQTITFHQGDLLQSLLGSSDSKPEHTLAVRGFRDIGALLATFRALSSIPLLDDLLSLVVDTAIELTGAERGFIMLKEADDTLSFRCARNNFKKTLDGSSFQTSRRVPDEVFRQGKRVVINDLEVDGASEDHSSTRRLGLRSISCVPLRYLAFREAGSMSGIGRMETIGVLYVDSQSIGTSLSSTQIDALETLASEAAMAIYNARLYRESQEKRKMDEELAIAREIQQALLPDPIRILPHVQAYSHNLPCREVGGDYFDYFELDGGRMAFALGDVAGKGMPAALLTSMLQGIFSAQTLLNLPVPSILSNANRNLARRGTGNRFVTFFFGVLDPDGTCTYANAGHNPPLLLHSDGSMEELTEGGMVLGLFPEAEYTSSMVRLKAGDHLVLYTDGVLEARDTKGDEFGEERLRELLALNALKPAQEILRILEEAIEEFSLHTPQHDDITMMILGYREAQSEPAPEPQQVAQGA